MSTVALVIPSYRRPSSLARAIAAAHNQIEPLDEIMVVARDEDTATHEVASATGVHLVTVSTPGVLAAMWAGAQATSSDVVGFCDDDATIDSHWARDVRRIFDLPGNERVGGVGGRDYLYDGDVPRATTLTNDVGRLTSWGRLVGNHHRGEGPAREVDVLKGVNCAYRRGALVLPAGLRGEGAQAHFEVAVGTELRRRGWRLLYDPSLRVDHRPDDRVGADQRAAPTAQAIADSAFNLERSLPRGLQSRRWLYVHALGDGACPGIARCVVALLRRERDVVMRRSPSWRGTTEAWRLRATPLSFHELP